MGAYDPDPDYFFHWFRDSALVMDALRILVADGTRPAPDAGHIRDFIRFSLGLRGLTGAVVLAKGDPRRDVDPDFVQHVGPRPICAASPATGSGARSESTRTARWTR